MTEKDVSVARARRMVAMQLQTIEDNPLSADQVAMFEMFEREAWSHEQRLAHIRERVEIAAMVTAAE